MWRRSRPFGLVVLLLSACDPAFLPSADGDGGPGGGICGDLTVNADEDCDDGGNDDGDGCSATCANEIPLGCGDGVLAGIEECDDENNEAGDGCGPGCWVEGCGNGHRDPGEACEDNNTVSGDGCSSDCRSDESCTNGIQDVGEECDDGNDIDTDRCPSSCALAHCGDGFVQSGHETCDDENKTADDGCTSCVLDSCGDGNDDTGEECDLGAANGTSGASCFVNCIVTQVGMGDPITIDLDVSDAIGTGPNALETADFNADGRADLLASCESGDFAVTYGFGDGRFWAPHYRNYTTAATDITLVDINRDAFPDAAVSISGGSVGVFLGQAVGFGPATTVTTSVDGGGVSPKAIAAGDVNGDGEVDLVTANQSSNDVVILIGDGAGNFTATTRLSTLVGDGGIQPVDVAIADITGDGKLDIVTANTASDDLAVFIGEGSGSFRPPALFTTRIGAGGDAPLSVVLADVTNDGVRDAITVHSASDDVAVLTSDGDGAFNPPMRFSTLTGQGGGDNPTSLAVADVTGDSVRDIVVASASNDVVILRGLGAGVAFAAPVARTISVSESGVNPGAVAVTDLDADGKKDIVTMNQNSNDATVLRGTGMGEFAAAATFETTVGDAAIGPRAMAVGDLNADGALDVVVAGSGRLVVVAGLGDGRLAPAQMPRPGLTGAAGLGDVDGDGRVDVVVPHGSQLLVAKQGSSGDFVQGLSPGGASGNLGVALGDVDGDADLDSVAIDAGFSRAHVYANGGVGNLASPAPVTTLSDPRHIVLAEVTGDSALDIVTAVGTNNAVSIASGTGTGAFSQFTARTTAVSTSGQTPVFVQVVDVNADDRPDLITANRDSNDVSLLLGTGPGAFASPTIIAAVFGGSDANVQGVRAGDFNEDGLVDLATVNRARDTVSILMGFGDGGFAAPQSFNVGSGPEAIAVGDFDGDGFADVATANADGTLTIRRGAGHQ